MRASLESLQDMCLKAGHTLTLQRRAVLEVLAEARDHPDIETIYARATRIMPGIGKATVYRCVNRLVELGGLQQHNFHDGESPRYEVVPVEHHDHLVNMQTGEIIEFCEPAIERLQVEVAQRYGFRLVDHRLVLYVTPLQNAPDTQ
ncbi:MAG: transcriptional repressor [Alphaproteobacteria bacterium]|nr:transcriptional repressor [Alphaproteobacteria bacterium]